MRFFQAFYELFYLLRFNKHGTAHVAAIVFVNVVVALMLLPLGGINCDASTAFAVKKVSEIDINYSILMWAPAAAIALVGLAQAGRKRETERKGKGDGKLYTYVRSAGAFNCHVLSRFSP